MQLKWINTWYYWLWLDYFNQSYSLYIFLHFQQSYSYFFLSALLICKKFSSLLLPIEKNSSSTTVFTSNFVVKILHLWAVPNQWPFSNESVFFNHFTQFPIIDCGLSLGMDLWVFSKLKRLKTATDWEMCNLVLKRYLEIHSLASHQHFVFLCPHLSS